MEPLLSEVHAALCHAQMLSCFCEPGTPEYHRALRAEERLHALYFGLTHGGPLTASQEKEAGRTLAEILGTLQHSPA
jgi:hypothetical protein